MPLFRLRIRAGTPAAAARMALARGPARGALLALAASLGTAGAQPGPTVDPAAQPASGFVLSDDGALVIDTRARLAWARCIEGMRWDGRDCVGTPVLFSYGQAQALVRERWRATGVRWRLPRVPEARRLQRLLDGGPAPDGAPWLPAAPREWHWSGTASVNATAVNPYDYGTVVRGGSGAGSLSVQQAWAVDMASGEARGDVGRANKLVVRLLRPAPLTTTGVDPEEEDVADDGNASPTAPRR